MTQDELNLVLDALKFCHGGEPCGTAEAIAVVEKALTQRTWVDLTDEDIFKISQRLGIDHDDSWTDLKQAIEAKLKQKNGYAEEKKT